VFPVHGIGGMLGTFAAGIFASDTLGVFSGRGYAPGVTMAHQIGIQLLGIVSVALYAGGMTWLLMKIVAALTGLRVTAEEETLGLDTTQHNERGYDLQSL
jgi:Amt family ammonium transporter